MSNAFDRPDTFDQQLFLHPESIDRGAPFWSWNGRLERDRLFHQLSIFEKMGLGGAHIHPRTGLETTYLGEEFMSLVEDLTDEAERQGLHVWLYDEDRWPSGFAGGLATAEERHRLRHLRLSRTRIAPGEARPCPSHHSEPLPLSERTFVAAWALTFHDSTLAGSRRVSEDTTAGRGEELLFAYLEVPPAWTWFNNTQYVDTLSPEAMRAFIDTTHERYAAAVGDRFGSVIPAIFTDEPLFRGMDFPHSAEDTSDIILSWTEDLPDTYRAAYGEELLEVLPDILYDRVDGRHQLARWRFHNHHTDRFSQAFAAQLGAWCREHGIALTGHMMAEESLAGQTTWTGEAMRSLKHFGLPGIDKLCDRLELSTAKQAQSAARQNGAPGIMSELYGVTNWDFPFAGHKRQGDWQAALGVITRVQHLTWYQMSGEAKRDYPASIGEHSPWWHRYRVIEDHFARLNVALKSGRPRCRVAMIHPIESYWLVHGPAASARERTRLEVGFSQTLSWLLEDLIDVDFVSEAFLADAGGPVTHDLAEPRFQVGEMAYEAVVVPPVITLRSTTLEALHAFAQQGGTVISMDGGPKLRDAEFPATARDIERFTPVSFERSALLNSLEPFRDVRLKQPNGDSPTGVVHQIRQLPDGSWIVFVCRFDENQYSPIQGAHLSLRGSWALTKLNTEDGSEQQTEAHIDSGWTTMSMDLPIAGHVLLHAKPASDARSFAVAKEAATTHVTAVAPAQNLRNLVEINRLPAPQRVTLEEENVLVLDTCEWRLDGGPWQPAQEILRVDNAVRSELGMPERSGNIAQPWVEPRRRGEHCVTLAYTMHLEHETARARLALEDGDNARVTIDGATLTGGSSGEWIDAAFTTFSMPSLSVGVHRLEIEYPFGGSEGLEACYLVGDFGVRASGKRVVVTEPGGSLVWGDATQQGLAFYGGNIRYQVNVELPAGTGRYIQIPHFGGALVDVCWPGREPEAVYREPWLTPIPDGLQGSTRVELVCYGTRINTFGQLHIVAEGYKWWGPQSWRTTGVRWADEYQLRPTGILVAPSIWQ